jgi:ATP-dependent Clp protease ATP-binding subunit ClpC
MFERFTDRARHAVVQAQVEARELRHNFIGSEHLLLGLIHEDEGLAVQVLRTLNVDPEALAGQVRQLVGTGHESVIVSEHIPFTPVAKKTLEGALREAQRLHHDYIGTEHMLLSILSRGEGAAYDALHANGVDLETARAQVSALLGEYERTTTVRRTTVRMPGGLERIPDTDFQLAAISRRLAAIEAKLGIEPSPAGQRLRELELSLARVRKAKVTAIDDKDFGRGAALRDEEKKLLAEHRSAQLAWLAEGAEEPPSL